MITTDFSQRERLAKLLRYESSLTDAGQTTSLEEYVSRMPETQKEIYFLYAPSRESIEAGPYLEAFTTRNLEVLFLYEPIDEFVMNHLNAFDEKKLVAADSAEIDLAETDTTKEEVLSEEEQNELIRWSKDTLGENGAEVAISKRPVHSPAAALNPDRMMTASMRRIMKAMNQDAGGPSPVRLEINPSHPLMKKLCAIKSSDPETAQLIADQVFDNSMVAAGFIEDPRTMVNRIYQILEKI